MKRTLLYGLYWSLMFGLPIGILMFFRVNFVIIFILVPIINIIAGKYIPWTVVDDYLNK